jgi:hypothetical protein
MAENKWAVVVDQLEDKSFSVQWIERKMYTAQDGQSFPDEIWTTKEGEIKCIQDLEPEHARNVLRMVLRNERKRSAAVDELTKAIMVSIETGEDLDDVMPSLEPQKKEPKVLH